MTLAQFFFGTLFTTLLSGGWTSASGQSAKNGSERAIGSWSFQSVPYRDDTCQMSGTMHIRPQRDASSLNADGLSCAFTAVEACVGQDRWIVEQICTVEQSANQLSIRSSIVNFIEADTFTGSYLPDHFVLTIESASRMKGQIISSISAGVEFVRQEEAVS